LIPQNDAVDGAFDGGLSSTLEEAGSYGVEVFDQGGGGEATHFGERPCGGVVDPGFESVTATPSAPVPARRTSSSRMLAPSQKNRRTVNSTSTWRPPRLEFAPNLTTAVGLLLARTVLSPMDVPTRQAYVMTLVPAGQRTRAAAVTNTAGRQRSSALR
jgi:hypothetical protein